MKERTGISKSYQKHFCLDETKLRKIVEVFRKYSEKIKENTYLTYFVRREDNSYYETQNIDLIIDDDNTKGKSIQRLVISLLKSPIDEAKKSKDSKDENIAFVSFMSDKDDKATFSIEEKERDWCFLFSDELDSQIQRTLTKYALSFFKSRIIEIATLLFVGAILVFCVSALTIKEPTLPLDAIQKMTTEMKIQKLLELHTQEQNKINWFIPLLMVSWSLILASIEIRPISRIYEKFYRSVFYWGDMKTDFDRFKNRVNYIKWGIIIAFIVSLLAGIAIKFIWG
jgi:hypothetical protein